MAAVAALVPAIKALVAGAGRQAVIGAAKQGVKQAAKQIAKDKAKDFVTGKGRKKKKRKGKGRKDALTTTGEDEGSEEGGSEEGGGAIVPVTPIVGSYRVETPPQKPEEVGKPSKVNYETINKQLDSIVGLTNALKKTSVAKMKTAENRRKAERKAVEKSKKRQRESLLERGAGMALGAVGSGIKKASGGFDLLKFFTNIFLGSLLMWILTNGSKIIGFLKIALALFNNAGKLLKLGFNALKSGFKAALKAFGKIGSPLLKVGGRIGKALRGVGSFIGKAFSAVGNGLKNFALGIINKLKALGKALNPLRGLQALSGAEKKSLQTNKGLNKITKTAGGVASNAGTASRATGTMSNAARSVRLKHGDEAARMYQQMVDNGMKPSRAAQHVNKAVKSGKLTSQPLQGLARSGGGSQIIKGGLKKTGKRALLKIVGKGGLKTLKRIPVVGPLISLVVSLLSGDPISQAMFKGGGALLGGFLGSFIPIPVVGTLVGELIGEYTGDLMYHLLLGGGPDAVGKKLQDDIKGVLSVGKAAIDWAGDGFKRLYEGLPRINLFGYEGLVNFPSLLLNPLQVIPTVYKAFFTRDPMEKGEEKTEETSDDVTNMNPDRAYTVGQGDRAGDFVNLPDGSLRVNTGQGTRALTPEEMALYQSGATNIDGSKTPVPTTSNAGYWGPLLEAIAKKESYRGSYDSIYPSTTKVARYGGKPLTEMTIREADAWQASTYRERGSAAAGRYQFMSILSQATTYSDVKPDDLFNAENQDKMAIGLIVNKRKITPEMIKNDPNKAMLRIAQEWAAFPVPTDMQGHKQFVRAGQSYYAGDGRNASGATVAEMRAAFAKLGAPPAQQPQQSVQPQTPKIAEQTYTVAGVTYDVSTGLPISGHEPQTPLVPGNVTPSQSQQPSVGPKLGGLSGHSGSVSYNGQQQASLSVAYSPFAQSDITSQGMQIISGKGYRASTNSVHKGFDVPAVKGTPVYAYLPGKITQNRSVSGYGNIVEWQDSIYGEKHMFAHLMEPGPLPVGTEFQAGTLLAKTGDTGTPGSYHLHWEIGAQGSEKDPASWVASHPIKNVPQAQVQQAQQPQQSGSVTPSTGSVTTGPQSSPSTTSAQVSSSPQVQAQRSNEITDVSQQLPYEQSGSTVVMMQGPGGQQIPMMSGGGKGTPVIMGSGDVVNSYYKSQLMGFLYKQG